MIWPSRPQGWDDHLKQDGIRKIIDGITTIREVRRVCVE